MNMRCFALAVVLALSVATSLRAEVTRVEIQRREDVLGGKAFGSVGAYEKLVGQGPFRRRSRQPAQQDHRRPRQGAEERPGQGRVLVRSLHHQAEGYRARQRRGLLRHRQPRQQAAAPCRSVAARGSADPTTEADFGDAYLLREGYTLVAVGWQFDVAKGKGLVGFDAPMATDNGTPITGWVQDVVRFERAHAVVRVRGERLQHSCVSAARSQQPAVSADRA